MKKTLLSKSWKKAIRDRKININMINVKIELEYLYIRLQSNKLLNSNEIYVVYNKIKGHLNEFGNKISTKVKKNTT